MVREGKKVTLEDAAGQKIAVEKADIKAGEAIVHVIDVSASAAGPSRRALMPSDQTPSAAGCAATSCEPQPPSLLCLTFARAAPTHLQNVAIPLALAAAEMPEGMAPMPEMVEAAKAAAGSVVASAAALAASVLAAALLA